MLSILCEASSGVGPTLTGVMVLAVVALVKALEFVASRIRARNGKGVRERLAVLETQLNNLSGWVNRIDKRVDTLSKVGGSSEG